MKLVYGKSKIQLRLEGVIRGNQWKDNKHILTVGILKEIFNKTKGKCTYCKTKITLMDFSLDHKIPRVSGGTNKKSNLVACCLWCNKKKNTLSVKEFMKKLKVLTQT